MADILRHQTVRKYTKQEQVKPICMWNAMVNKRDKYQVRAIQINVKFSTPQNGQMIYFWTTHLLNVTFISRSLLLLDLLQFFQSVMPQHPAYHGLLLHLLKLYISMLRSSVLVKCTKQWWCHCICLVSHLCIYCTNVNEQS